MKQLTLFETNHQVGEKPTVTFFPKMIRGYDDQNKPTYNGDKEYVSDFFQDEILMMILDPKYLEIKCKFMMHGGKSQKNYPLIRFEDLDKKIKFYNLEKKELSAKNPLEVNQNE